MVPLLQPPHFLFSMFQSIHPAAATVIFLALPSDDGIPAPFLGSLPWLHVSLHRRVKLLAVTLNTWQGAVPAYSLVLTTLLLGIYLSRMHPPGALSTLYSVNSVCFYQSSVSATVFTLLPMFGMAFLHYIKQPYSIPSNPSYKFTSSPANHLPLLWPHFSILLLRSHMEQTAN